MHARNGRGGDGGILWVGYSDSGGLFGSRGGGVIAGIGWDGVWGRGVVFVLVLRCFAGLLGRLLAHGRAWDG